MFGGLMDSVDKKHSVYLLANSINWAFFDESLDYFSISNNKLL